VWDAEDLVQDTLLKGFGAIGRGDLHGDESRVRNPRAYLVRIATNLWIDRMRRVRPPELEVPPPAQPGPTAVREAGEALFRHASPQQRAAVVLKDVFAFSLEEIAVVLNTTPGSIKNALHRGRSNLASARETTSPPSKELVDAFVAAFNRKDVAGLTSLLLENTSIEVHGVGGGRGQGRRWAESSFRAEGQVECFVYEGEPIVVVFSQDRDERVMVGITRIEGLDGAIIRLRSYGYCPETMQHVAESLGLPMRSAGYHQGADVLPGMIETTQLPWIGD